MSPFPIGITYSSSGTGKGEQKTEWFAQAIAPIRQQCDIIVNVTTGGSGKREDGDWLSEGVPAKSNAYLVVAMIGDNHIRAIAESSEAWTDVEILKLAVPANKTRHGFDYYLDVTYRLKDKLDSLVNSKLSKESLREEIDLHNKMRALLNQLSMLRKNEHPPLSGKDSIIF